MLLLGSEHSSNKQGKVNKMVVVERTQEKIVSLNSMEHLLGSFWNSFVLEVIAL